MREIMDTTGLRFPLPVLKIAHRLGTMKPGDILEVRGDCPTFERDVRQWCEQMNKNIVSISNSDPLKKNGRTIRIQI